MNFQYNKNKSIYHENCAIMNNFNQKKIGIWGFGVVGKSALAFFEQFNLESIEILNNKSIDLPQTKNACYTTIQDSTTINKFFNTNDYILVSPGISLHNFQEYQHKFISELDLFYHHNKIPTIAITGSLGKTSITHLITNILQKNKINVIAAGNIGYAMLNLVTSSIKQDKNIDTVALELSSFQLQQSHKFAPDLAIITNIYDNHLDHHKSIEEYCNAKYNIFKRQNNEQIALFPYDLFKNIHSKFDIKKNWAFFSVTKPSLEQLKLLTNNIFYYLENKIIYKIQNDKTIVIFKSNQLPPITFDINWLIIIAALDLQKISLKNFHQIIEQMDIPNHRLQKIASLCESDFYNDSKSTVWQATLQAVEALDQKPIKLFLGGLSKGVDRTPLLQALRDKNIEIYAFGKEANIISDLCNNFNITHVTHATLQESFDSCMKNIKTPSNILFSPAGTSFDLFDNYVHRGQIFTQLVHNYITK